MLHTGDIDSATTQCYGLMHRYTNAESGQDVPVAKEITIHDVARLASVSPSTVSNLLNGRHDRMRPETKERIEQAIERLGYTPNRLARQLKSGYAPIIGLIVPSVANPFWGGMARAV